MSYGYGGRGANPFDQRDDGGGGGGYGGGYNDGYGGGGGGGYGAPQPPRPAPGAFGQGPRPGGGARYNNGPSMGRDEYGSGNVEMASLAQNASSPANSDPNAILNECRSIDQGIDKIEANLNQLRMLQDRSLNETDTSGSNTTRQLDSLSSETMGMYRQLTERVRQVKSQKEGQMSKNAPQVGRVDRRLKSAIQQFQQVESAFRKKTQDQMARQYRIVKPDASEAEVRAVVDDTRGGQQVFQQAMMQSDRQGQARAVLSAVQDRQAALQKIEQQMVELAQLFQDMDVLVVQQEEQIIQIEQKGEEVVENLDKGNEEMGTAVVTARKTRKKKWICLGICVTIVVVIVVAVVAYVMINRSANGATKKRSIDDLVVRGIEWGPEGPPVAAVYAQSKIATEDGGSSSGAPPLSHIGARSMKYGKRYIVIDPSDLPPTPAKRFELPGGVFSEAGSRVVDSESS